MPRKKNKTEDDSTLTRKVILEYNRKIRIHSYTNWRKKFTGEFKSEFNEWGVFLRTIKPTLESQGFTFTKEVVDFNVLAEQKIFENVDVVKFILAKQLINNPKEVVYIKNWTGSGRRISFHLYYK